MARFVPVCVAVLGLSVLLLAGCGSSSQVVAQKVVSALVSANGRTITVAAQGGGCTTGADLVATESSADVRLRLTVDMTGSNCASDVRLVQASATLPDPLGARKLIDERTGRTVSYIPAHDLAQPRWLPAGASEPQGSLMNGWTRTYTFPTSRRLAPLTIAESIGRYADQTRFTAIGDSSSRLSIHGHPAHLVLWHDSGKLDGAFVGWVEGRYSIIVSSEPARPHQRVLSPHVLLRAARGLRVPARAQ